MDLRRHVIEEPLLDPDEWYVYSPGARGALDEFDVYFAIRLALVEWPEWRIRSEWDTDRAELRVYTWHEDRHPHDGGVYLHGRVTREGMIRGDLLMVAFLGRAMEQHVRALMKPGDAKTLTHARLDGLKLTS